MTTSLQSTPNFPIDPLAYLGNKGGGSDDYHRRIVQGILDSYHGNYDALSEAVQNSVDAIEDAALKGCAEPFVIEVTVNLADNWISVLDTGVGMSAEQVAGAFAPNVSFKHDAAMNNKRGSAGKYRGFKGVGMTFLSYGCDEIIIHTKQEGQDIIKGKMEHGRAWASGERNQNSVIVEDRDVSPLETYAHGTYLQVQLSQKTRPKSLKHIATDPRVWETILRTRTAIGQVLIDAEPIVEFKCVLHVIDADRLKHKISIEPRFVFPHMAKRKPAFRFLNVPDFWERNGSGTLIDPTHKRQDGIYLFWDEKTLVSELSAENQKRYEAELALYKPCLYAFLPYQTSIWHDINQALTGQKNRTHLSNGLVLAINRQRLAEYFEIEPTRYENLSLNMFVLVHFENARPDQGRKTVQEEVFDLARKASDRAVQYMARQREFLRPPGEVSTPEQRDVEKDHEDWLFNVKTHAKSSSLNHPPLTYQSIPLAEQDVVGLFHQLSALGVFAGIRIYATSQIQTYDCLVDFNADEDSKGLCYVSSDKNPLGVSNYTLGGKGKFRTKSLTLEFKNNIDGLVEDISNHSSLKKFGHIDICVCWGRVGNLLKGYSIEAITESNLDRRLYPGVTHLLSRDSETHVIQVIMLESVIQMIKAGNLEL